MAKERDDYGRAAALLADQFATYRELGEERGMASALGNLGELARCQGDYGRALALAADSLAAYTRVGDRQGMALALNTLGDVALVQGDPARALAAYAEALQVCDAIGDVAGVTEGLEGLAAVAAQQHELEHAVWLCGAAAGLREAAGMPVPPTDRATYKHIMRTARTALGDDAFAAAWEGGQAVPLEQAVAAALAPPQTRSLHDG